MFQSPASNQVQICLQKYNLESLESLNQSVHFYKAESVQFNLFQSKRFLYMGSGASCTIQIFLEWNPPQSRYIIHLSEEKNSPGKPKEPSLIVLKWIAKYVSSHSTVRPFPIIQHNSPAKLEISMKARSTFGYCHAFSDETPGFCGESSSVAGGLDCWSFRSFLCRQKTNWIYLPWLTSFNLNWELSWNCLNKSPSQIHTCNILQHECVLYATLAEKYATHPAFAELFFIIWSSSSATRAEAIESCLVKCLMEPCPGNESQRDCWVHDFPPGSQGGIYSSSLKGTAFATSKFNKTIRFLCDYKTAVRTLHLWGLTFFSSQVVQLLLEILQKWVLTANPRNIWNQFVWMQNPNHLCLILSGAVLQSLIMHSCFLQLLFLSARDSKFQRA